MSNKICWGLKIQHQSLLLKFSLIVLEVFYYVTPNVQDSLA